MKNKPSVNRIILGILIGLTGVMGIYSFAEVAPTVYIYENTNYKLLSVESMWYSPTADFYYADSLVYILGKGKKIKVYRDCPYFKYFKAYIDDIEEMEEEQPRTDTAAAAFQYIGKCDMKANRQFIHEEYMEKLAASDGIIGVYINAGSIAEHDEVKVLVDAGGDIYLYGE